MAERIALMMSSDEKRRFAAGGLGWLLAIVVAAAGGATRADDVYYKSGPQAAELQMKNVTIKTVKDGELYFTITGGGERHRPIDEIGRIDLNGEPQFNAADKAFSDGRSAKDEPAARPKFSEAVAGYTQTLGSTNKPWLKDYIAHRMLIAAPRSGRLDAALDAWRVTVEKDPAAAAKSKPSLEGIDAKSQYLSNAVKTLQGWVAASNKPDVQRVYLEMLYDVETAMGDADAAVKTLERRVALGGTPEEVANVQRDIALNDLANRRYDAAAERAGKINLAALNDAGRADVAYLLAECKAARMQPTASADQWKDLAIDYMRVVAGAPQSANAGAALLKVAEIHETLKDPETALKVYQQVVREHANTPAGQAAQKGVERLGKSAAARG
jgi:tetratricopeptide (TPR) repeat protein